MSTLHILWDESHVWGLLAWRAVESMGLPYRLVRAQEIADGLLSRNPPALLLVPGGTARLKADVLGETGMQATHTAHGVDLEAVARGCGLKVVSGEVQEIRKAVHSQPGPNFAAIKVLAEKIPLVLPPREGALLKARFRRALLGPDADLT